MSGTDFNLMFVPPENVQCEKTHIKTHYRNHAGGGGFWERSNEDESAEWFHTDLMAVFGFTIWLLLPG